MERAHPAGADSAHAALNLAMRAGDLLLSAGMSAHDMVATMLAISIAAGASLGTFLGRPIVDQVRRVPIPAGLKA